MNDSIVEAEDAVAPGRLAREIARAHAEQPAVGHDVHEACANCGTIRQGPYCHACGQFGHVHRSAGALVHDIAHGVFHFEGKFLTTLPLLALRPGELTRRYVRGERAKFVSPLALFLFSVFLLFAVAAGVPGGVPDVKQVNVDRAAFTEGRARMEARLAALRNRSTQDADARATLAGEIEAARRELAALRVTEATIAGRPVAPGDADGLTASMRTGWRWLDDAVARAARNPEFTLYKLKSSGYKYSWTLIPISLPFLCLLFAFRRDVGLYDHAIFAIYSLSFMSLALVVLMVAGALGMPSGAGVLLGLSVPPIHMYRQLKGAYVLTRAGALWRTAALLAATVLASLTFLAFLLWIGDV